MDINYKRINNLTGWMVCLIACTVYLLTMERTVSFWDTGEFISGAYKLQVPHPPGAPLFLLIARFFVILFGDNSATAALAVNSMSALASGFTILFLFWTITWFSKKIIVQGLAPTTTKQVITIMSAGVTGALAYTFSDSFWFSAVEGEVYALSSFFTALVFWCILKWEQRADQPGADKWLVFIFFLVGLSIGVHLLNLLAIPAIVMVFYFKKFKASFKSGLLAFITGCIITGFIQVFVIQYSVRGAGAFDLFFVNELGLPFFSGFAFFFLLVAALLVVTIIYADRRKLYFLKLGAWSVIFMLIGYSTYLTTTIRSNANTAMDMFNVDNPMALEGYLGRQQYGDWPIMYGPDFTTRAPYKSGGDLYQKTANRYASAGKISREDWSGAEGAHIFPRLWDNRNDRNQHAIYRTYTGLAEDETPRGIDNLKFFATYQAGWMYMRYFMWNFAGKQNDLQGYGNVRDSNWISGVPFIDNVMYGSQDQLPDSIRKENKAHNRLYMLPLALGIAGMIFQYKKNRQQFLVNGLLFFFTGLAIVIYLNQSGTQPRERDYAFVGSFYAFAIWIGLGAAWLHSVMDKARIKTYGPMLAAALGLSVPVLMAAEEWDDHDRSQKTLARDMAKAYLESCPKDAILFTFEDNDTYPLWYAQEVEGIRPDVRVMVHTLAGTDWYMNQLRYKVNESAPFDLILNTEQTAGSKREVLYYQKTTGYDENKFYDLRTAIKDIIGSDDPRLTATGNDGETYNLLPVRKFSVQVDVEAVKKSGLVKSTDTVVSEIKFDLSVKNFLLRNDLVVLAALATSNWQRPVCFTSPTGPADLGLEKYTRQEGMIYRLVPVENSVMDSEKSFQYAMKFDYGNTAAGNIYLDEDNRRRLNMMKLSVSQIAIRLAEEGQPQKARQVLSRFGQMVSSKNLPHGMTTNRGNQHNAISLEYLRAARAAGDKDLAHRISDGLITDLQQQLRYYRYLGDDEMNDDTMAQQAYNELQGKGSALSGKQFSFVNDILSSYQLLHQVQEWKEQE